MAQNKLELVTGIPVSNQALSLYNAEEDTQPVATLDDDDRLLGYYNARDWQFLKVCPHSCGITRFTDYTVHSDRRHKPFDNVYRSTQ